MELSRFREAKTAEEEVNLVRNAVPKSTQYKNKWAYRIFEDWQRQRLVKVPIVVFTGLFKTYDFHLVESLDTPLVEMSVLLSSSRRLRSFCNCLLELLKLVYSRRCLCH